ncbi:helix-turn-helix transcriptional regulator [Nocardioides limicola]|uniref:helix-turn-helix transcriptional regulator n=1 Tax=Nocardioides limicola TaxID=2803368 RepID=UPI00193B1E33|nr:helix-turn-helix transcriptional regulator [Nocardioides sp. DJM-14]
MTALVDSLALRRARERVREACTEAATTAELLQSLLEALRTPLRIDAAFLGATDPETTVFSSAAVIENMPETMCAPWMDNEFLQPDVNKFIELHRSGEPATTLHRATGNQPTLSHRHVHINSAMGFAPELRTTFSLAGSCWGVAHLLRSAECADFDDAEVRLMDEIREDVADALRRIVLAGPEVDDALCAPGVVTLDAQGRVVSMTDSAIGLLAELQHSPVRVEHHGDLPGEAFMVATVARARARDVPYGVVPAVPAVNAAVRAMASPGASVPAVTRLRGRSGRWLTVRGDCTRTADGEIAATVLVIEPSRPHEIMPLAVAAYGLTAREQDVLTELAAGRATAEIGRRLFISEHTVRDHIKAIFTKTGATSRGELLHALFFSHAYPVTEFRHT